MYTWRCEECNHVIKRFCVFTCILNVFHIQYELYLFTLLTKQYQVSCRKLLKLLAGILYSKHSFSVICIHVAIYNKNHYYWLCFVIIIAWLYIYVRHTRLVWRKRRTEWLINVSIIFCCRLAIFAWNVMLICVVSLFPYYQSSTKLNCVCVLFIHWLVQNDHF